METRILGPFEVSTIGLGCNNFGMRLEQDGTTAVVQAALDHGITFFDTADIYGGTNSEVQLGSALGARRDEAIIATKFGMPIDDDRRGAAPSYVQRACEDSLRRLGIEVIDLYQLHAPDPEVPIADTLGALDDLVEAGKVRAIGCSNFTPDQLHAAADAAGDGARFVSLQNQYSLLWREPEPATLEACAQLGMGLLPYYPLGNGLLTGKYRKGEPLPEGTRLQLMAALAPQRSEHWLSDSILDQVEQIRAISEASGIAMVDLAFGWLLSRPVVSSVIAGASNPDQVATNAAAGAVPLPLDVIASLDAIAAA